MNENSNIFVAGHNGMVGSAIVRGLKKRGFLNIITANREDLDLMNQMAVNNFFKSHHIDIVIMQLQR